ncbi:DUF2490 domain-containing protein [Formosa sediminum]|uniref:DUF2490 domain-containing protein n=1 Tax=Formosa sediminum TaxID=2594004 RepID=A0A516GMP2_9FLAO|nr:DUF2490 domain-containing protein [Formosa sediminum]QDO92801.1 DUF2490 domain-containing protein [Formosa sediminum]
MRNTLAYIDPFKNLKINAFLKCIFSGLCFILALQQSTAQERADADTEDNEFTRQIWFDLDPSWSMGDGQKITANFGYRTISPKSWHRFIVKANFEKKFEKLLFKRFNHSEKLFFGTNFFILTTKDNDDYGSFEIRPLQGYELGIDLTPRIVFKQLFRLEERFVFSSDPENQIFGLRFRYQIKAVFNLEGVWFEAGEGFYIPVAIEGFFNLVSASQFNDVIRLTPGLGYQFNPDFKVEGSLAYHYTQQGGDYNPENLERTNDIVFRFRIIKTFK